MIHLVGVGLTQVVALIRDTELITWVTAKITKLPAALDEVFFTLSSSIVFLFNVEFLFELHQEVEYI